MFNTRPSVPGEQEKKLWALTFWKSRSSINMANIQPRNVRDTILHRIGQVGVVYNCVVFLLQILSLL